MTERQVTIKLDVIDGIGDRLAVIKRQRDDLLAKSKIGLNIDTSGLEQARRASAQASAASASAIKDMGLLGSAITSKAVAPLAQYSQMLASVTQAGKAMGPGIVSALRGVSVEFARQRDLAAFWGTSGYMHGGVNALKSSLSSFLATGGQGFTSWLQTASANLAQYRTALTVAAAAMIGMAAAAGLSSKHSQNYIRSTLDSRLMARKLPDKEGAAAWIESAQGQDWSAGRDSRMGTFQTVLSKNKSMGQKAAQKATEDIEKYFFANQEMLQKKGIASAEQLASEISAPQLTGDSAAKFEDIFGLGFASISAPARLARLGAEAPDDMELEGAVNARPDEVLSKRLTATTAAMGDAVLPALNAVLGGFIKLSDIIGKIPGLGKAMGWGAVLLGAASAGLVMVSMVGSLIPGLMNVIGLFSKMGIVTKLAAAGQWLLNAAMTANPLGIAIVAIAGLVAGLYMLEKKFGLVTKAWKAFSESSIGKGIFAAIADGKKSIEDLLGALGKAYKAGGVGGVLKIALEGIVANSPLFKMVAFIFDILRKLWANSTTLNKLFSAGIALWAKITDFFAWLLDSIKSGLQWIRDGLGVTRSDAKAKMEKQAAKEGLVWHEAIGNNPAQWYKNGLAAGVNAGSDTLNRLKGEYVKAPKGFFEGIPGIKDLTDALNSLTAKLGEKVTQAATAASSAVASAAQPMMSSDIAKVNQQLASGQPVSRLSTDMGNPSGLIKTVYRGITGQDLWPGADVGGPITGSGGMIGHKGEEVNPADVVLGGETTLEKINKLFQGGAPSSGQSISVSAPINIHVDKIDSSVDLERALAKAGDEFDRKLLFRLRNSLDSTSTRGIGYMRA